MKFAISGLGPGTCLRSSACSGGRRGRRRLMLSIIRKQRCPQSLVTICAHFLQLRCISISSYFNNFFMLFFQILFPRSKREGETHHHLSNIFKCYFSLYNNSLNILLNIFRPSSGIFHGSFSFSFHFHFHFHFHFQAAFQAHFVSQYNSLLLLYHYK